MAALSPRLARGVARSVGRLLTHRCRLTPMTAGVEDPEGNVTPVPGTPVDDVPCLYTVNNRAIRDEGGATVVAVPTLSLSASQEIAPGYIVEAITDQLGGVLHPGPLRVERLADDTAGLGAPLLPVWELRGAEAVL